MNLITERLIIRDLRMDDLDRFDALANSDFVLHYLCMYRMDREGSKQYLRQMIERQKDFAVALKGSDELIGKIHIDEDHLRYDVNSVDLAYWLGEQYTRQGYMTEALSAYYGVDNGRAMEIADKMLAKDNGYAYAHFYKARIYFDCGDGRCIEHLRAAMAADPDLSQTCINYIGRFALLSGDEKLLNEYRSEGPEQVMEAEKQQKNTAWSKEHPLAACALSPETQAELAEHHRCLAATRKRDHGELVNRLLQIGGTIKIEKNSFKSYQRNFGKSTTRTGMGMFVEHLKRKAASAGAKVVELNAYELKMSQYDPQTDTYRKKPLKERWHRWGNSDMLVQRDIMSAFLACYATEKGHDRSLLLRKWATAESLLSGSGLCRQQPRSDQEEPKSSLRLTKPRATTPAERERGLPQTFCAGSDVRSDCPFGDPAGRAFCRSE